jgi:pilus assembly protein CpaF
MPLKDRIRGQSLAAAYRQALAQREPPREAQAWDDAERVRAVKTRVQAAILAETSTPERLDRARLSAVVGGILDRDPEVRPGERDVILDSLVDEILGFGPIQGLLDDPTVSEIMINGPKTVYVERHGVLELTPVVFRDEEHLLAVLEKMLAFSGRRVDEASPLVDARLPDGSRLNAVVHPIAVRGVTVTIRKFTTRPLTMADLVQNGTLSPRMATFLEWAVRGRLNLLVSGGTASGKTTTLNAVSAFIPPTERIVTIEDAAELRLQQAHWVPLEARPANLEGQGEVSIRTLVRNALRMRPDRIIVGEVRGGEALDMLQAMNTGHDGGMTTLHANSPRDALSRLETMVLMAGTDLPLIAVRQQIASAIDVIVHQARLPDGSRRVVQITEVAGLEEGTILTQDLFAYHFEETDDGSIRGTFRATGVVSRHLVKLRTLGVPATPDLFREAAP